MNYYGLSEREILHKIPYVSLMMMMYEIPGEVEPQPIWVNSMSELKALRKIK